MLINLWIASCFLLSGVGTVFKKKISVIKFIKFSVMYKLSTSIAYIKYHIYYSVIKQAPDVHLRREGVGCWWWDGWAGRRCPHPRIHQSCDCHQKALPSCCHPGLASAPSVLWRSWEGAPAAKMRSPGSRKPWNAGCQLSRWDQHSYNTRQSQINKNFNSQLSQLEENTLYMS